MTADPADFHHLIRAVLARDATAADQFCRSYESYILRAVRLRLMRRLRSKFDSHDFVNDVWASFFSRPPADAAFDNPDAVIAYLERMARNKVSQAMRQRLRSLKYDVNRECPLAEAGPGSADDGLPGPCPTPSKLAAAREAWVRLLDGRPRHERRMLNLLRRGLTHREIAARLNTNEKTVQRLIRRLDRRPHA
jgi:RNA polymerase sigma-70 factor (ECF subfamily)